MTGASSLLSDVTTAVTYGLPVALTAGLTAGWALARFARPPPVLETVPPDRRWVKGPIDALEASLRDGGIDPAITATIARVDELLAVPAGSTGTERTRRFSGDRPRSSDEASLLEIRRSLVTAHRLAARAEGASPDDPFASWRRDAWRARARADLDAALDALRAPPSAEGAPT
ncbi:MAG TPA: hypothetical protein VMG99_05630 [Thermoplasmata archaeon]|nr:hypothetical protein [Thermoplasmata archaeon]